ncbi:BZ3500_MvSof-1268-A1-R1_Chr3-2g06311 [Microbotryum saponariae]|uniref:Cytochrome c oxidase subunit 13, mitochondrial n=1 Tax=Microbotryum saponariae TaxID=289078 RepID=A0A2X0L1Y5_9BASI|nr:BZ3500_MvSof-1268-A1-R1_Chr3-2g06311 [Microbotryum saponariae]SDA04282.1 BZ3501_MvSof-1269-A2-R1_Chr3-2g06002 [Microbotryum saponariae]
MSALFRTLRTTSRRAPSTVRSYATATEGSGANEFIKHREAIQHHAAQSAQLWRKITLYVACPAIVVGFLNAMNLMAEHEAHVEHIKHENGGELPERIVYPYFNKRIKEFPWGNHTLFYNPEVNINPDEE